MPPTTIKITNTLPVPATDPQRIGKKDVWVWYTADGMGPFFVILHDEDLSEEAVAAAIADEETKRKAWVGREFEVQMSDDKPKEESDGGTETSS